MNAGEAVVPLLFLVGWGVYTYVRHVRAQRHTSALAAHCAARGWRFSAEDAHGLADRWYGPPFDAGRRRRVRNVIAAEIDGRSVVAFDYSFVVRQGKHTKTYEYAVVTLGLPCPLPGLHVAPEGVLSRLGTMIGLEDIEVESEEFNRRFRVRCPDPRFAHDVLTPRTMHSLLSIGAVEFRFEDTDALCYELGNLDPDWVLAAVGVLRTVLAGVPSFVWRDRGVVA